MELLDVYDLHREKTGKTMVRGEAFPKGAYHLIVHVCIFRADGKMLIQQRQHCKKGWPDLWDVSVGGCATVGEDAQAAAARELFEELGLAVDFTETRPHLTVNFDKGFDDFFLIERNVELSELKLQPEEVQDVKWAAREEIRQMIADGLFVPYHPSLIDLLFDSRSDLGCFPK